MGSGLGVQIVITLGAVLLALVGGAFARRRTSADVEVTLSKEAREWVKDFRTGAQDAMEQAKAANDRAGRAESHAAALQIQLDALIHHIRRLEAVIRGMGGEPPALPVDAQSGVTRG